MAKRIPSIYPSNRDIIKILIFLPLFAEGVNSARIVVAKLELIKSTVQKIQQGKQIKF